MIEPDTFLVDANVPMYAAGAAHAYQIPSQEILERVTRGELRAVTDAEVHQEILHRFLALHLPEKAREVSEDFQTLVPAVLPVTMQDIERARALSISYIDLPARDLLHVAIMLNNGVGTIVSADRHFDQVTEIRRLDPIAAFGAV